MDTPLPSEKQSEPLACEKDKVIEAKVNSLGEVSELQPGKFGKLTVNLKPGAYILFCNQGGHVHQGMWTHFTVTP
jgi:uncharacterized cupredoxin-like copper-binding protein